VRRRVGGLGANFLWVVGLVLVERACIYFVFVLPLCSALLMKSERGNMGRNMGTMISLIPNRRAEQKIKRI